MGAGIDDAPPGQGQSTPDDWASSLAHLKKNTKIIQRIPKSVRGILAEKLSSRIDNALNCSQPMDWWELFLFAHTYLRAPESSSGKPGSMVSHIRHLLQNDAPPPPPTQYTTSRTEPIRRAQPHSTSEDLARRLRSKCADGDIKSALRLLTSDDTMAMDSAATIQALRAKHPPRPENCTLPQAPEDTDILPLQVDSESVLAAVTHMPSSSGSGLDGLRPKHLQQMLSKETAEGGRRLLESLTRLANTLLRGDAPDIICPALYGASLCALTKKDGGVRPIAVGSVYRRMTAKIAAKHVSGLLATYFEPQQMGVGTPGGCEATIHAARQFMQDSSLSNTPQILIKADVKNAFNSIKRSAFLEQILQHCPEIFPLMKQAYGFASPIFYGETQLKSETGLHQGDPLATLAFSLAIQPIIRQVSSPFNAWYLDDGTFGGGLEQALNDLGEMERRLSQIGLSLNHIKCEISILAHTQSLPQNEILARVHQVMPNITLTPSNRLTLLGAPLAVEVSTILCLTAMKQ